MEQRKEKEMNFWDKVKRDVQRGIREGMNVMKEGAAAARKKAEELTEEGKRQYKIHDLKMKAQKEMSELGGKVYDLSKRVKNPLADKKVQGIVGRIKKLENQILKLENQVEKKIKKVAANTVKKVKARRS